jgi:hypothetical protein
LILRSSVSYLRNLISRYRQLSNQKIRNKLGKPTGEEEREEIEHQRKKTRFLTTSGRVKMLLQKIPTHNSNSKGEALCD